MDIDNCSFIETPNTLYHDTNNFLKMIFICSGGFITGSFMAFICAANMLFKNVEKEYKNIYGYDSDEEEYYDSRFLKEYYDLEDKAIDNFDYLKDVITIEKTPDGLVYFGYDLRKEAFFYYCDFKDVQYNYLEVVARKFVIDNNCKLLLLNSKEEIIKAINNFREKKDQEEIKSTVFANLKTEVINKKDSIDHKLGIQSKEIPVPEKSNKYIYKGKLLDYKPSSDEKESDDNNDFENIDYSTFKSR